MIPSRNTLNPATLSSQLTNMAGLHTFQVLGLILLVSIQASAMEVCPDADFELWRGHCYSFHIDERVNWTTARQRCLNKSAGNVTVDLVSIHSADENVYVSSKRSSQQLRTWIGYNKGPNGDFKWIDGSLTDYSSWSPGNPHSDTEPPQNCATTTWYSDSEPLWHDQRCYLSLPYICKSKLGPPTCDAEPAGNVNWPKTPEGREAIIPCPGYATGEAYRKCLTAGKWDKPNFDNCIKKIFTDILDKISEISSGKNAHPDETKEIAQALEEALSEEMNGISPGNLNAALEAIDQISMVQEMFEEPPSLTEVESIVRSCSILVDKNNHQAWNSTLKKIPKKASKIMQAIDRYTMSFEKSPQIITDRIQIDTGNIALSLEPWKLGSGSISFPEVSNNSESDWVKEATDKLTLSNETLIQISKEKSVTKLLVASAYYRTLDQLLPGNNNSEMQKVGSNVLSVSVGNRTSDEEFQTPISFVLKIELEIKEGDTVVCSYWNFTSQTDGGWDDSGCETSVLNPNVAQCHCNHMTNFAVLVSSYDPPPHITRALSVISYVGCSLSTAGMCVTMLIYGILWREIGIVVHGNRSRQITLMNLCCVLTVANIIFLFGMDKTEPEGLCTAIAAILQYLFLVAFALMTVSSVTLYWKISSFTRGMQTDRTRNTVISMVTAWAIPMFIVTISLGVTETKGYGNKDFCWLSTDGGIKWSFIGPVVLATLVNSIILILVIRTKIRSGVYRVEGGFQDASQRNLKHSEMMRSSLWSALVLVPVMGTNWIFGILSVNEETIVFQFIFAFLNAFQGVFIMVFHCFADANVKKAWKRKFGLTPFERFGGLMRKKQEKSAMSETTPLESMATVDSRMGGASSK